MSAHNAKVEFETALASEGGVSGRMLVASSSSPTNGATGYAPGCLWIKTSATNNVYINMNTAASRDSTT
jgi:hypothetical protein